MAERLDMFRKTLSNPDKEPYKVSWDLAAEELGLGRTCPARVTGTQPGTQICTAKLGSLEDKEEPRHV
jgi:hypothetical protein